MGKSISHLRDADSVKGAASLLVDIDSKLIINALRRYQENIRHPGLGEQQLARVLAFLSVDDVRRVFDLFHLKASGMVHSIDLLCALVLFSGMRHNKRMKLLFEVFDLSGDGQINESEMTMGVLSCLRAFTVATQIESFTVEVAEQISRQAFEDAESDRLHDGKISYIEFWEWLTQNPTAREAIAHFERCSRACGSDGSSGGSGGGGHGGAGSRSGNRRTRLSTKDKMQMLLSEKEGDGVPMGDDNALQLSTGAQYGNSKEESSLQFGAKSALDRTTRTQNKRAAQLDAAKQDADTQAHLDAVFRRSAHDPEVDKIAREVEDISRRREERQGTRSSAEDSPTAARDGKGGDGAKRGRHASQRIKYNKREVLIFRDLFERLDRDGDGAVTMWEFNQELSKDPYAAEHLGGMFDALDHDDDGLVTIKEIICEMYPKATPRELQVMYEWVKPKSTTHAHAKRIQLTPEQEKEMMLVFDDYDNDHSGVLSVKELIAALTANRAFTKEEVKDYFARADISGNGELSREEFTDFFKAHFYDKNDFSLGDLANLDDVSREHRQAQEAISHSRKRFTQDKSRIVTF